MGLDAKLTDDAYPTPLALCDSASELVRESGADLSRSPARERIGADMVSVSN